MMWEETGVWEVSKGAIATEPGSSVTWEHIVGPFCI